MDLNLRSWIFKILLNHIIFFSFSGAHTLWELPVLTMRFGGVVFILIYLVMFLLLGTPMLLLEMTMGQYSALSPTKLYRNLCPVSESWQFFARS